MERLELIATVEDAFGFTIPEEHAQALNTAGRLCEYVLAQRFHGKPAECLSRIAFHKMQRALMSVLRVQKEAVRPSTELSALIPRRRRRAWREMQHATGLRLPQLRRPQWATAAAAFTTLVLAAAAPRLLSIAPFRGGGLLAIFTAFAAAHGFVWLTAPLAFRFQPDCTTAGQLAAATLARNYRSFVEQSSKTVADSDVWNTLQWIVARHLGVRPCEIGKQTDFTQRLRSA